MNIPKGIFTKGATKVLSWVLATNMIMLPLSWGIFNYVEKQKEERHILMYLASRDSVYHAKLDTLCKSVSEFVKSNDGFHADEKSINEDMLKNQTTIAVCLIKIVKKIPQPKDSVINDVMKLSPIVNSVRTSRPGLMKIYGIKATN